MEKPIKSPLWRFRREHCNDCSHSDACKGDKTLETRCILASISLSLEKLTEKMVLALAHL